MSNGGGGEAGGAARDDPAALTHRSRREPALTIAYAVYAPAGRRLPFTCVLTGGGVSGMRETWPSARRIGAALGCDVLVWDRRNTGASGFSLGGDGPRLPLAVRDAEDLHDLLLALRVAPAVLLGKSSGARVSALLASRHPDAVRGLVLAPPTGGAFAVEELCEMYYEAPKRCMRSGDADAVASAWGMRDPDAVARLRACDAREFADAMDASSAWLRRFPREAMLGLTDRELAALAARGVRVQVAHSGDTADRLHDAPSAVAVAARVGARHLHLVPGLLTGRADERLAELVALVGEGGAKL